MRYAHKDDPVPDGWRFEPLTYHYDKAAGYGMLICEDRWEEQIFLAVYDGGVRFMIEGKDYFKQMTREQMIYLAQDLLTRAVKNDGS